MIRDTSISGLLGTAGTWILNSIVNLLAAFRVHPNVLTLIGLFINIFAAVLFAKGMFTWAGLVVWYAKMDKMFYATLVGLSLIGSIMTSYTRARAESLIPACKVGFLERPERIVLLIIGSLTNRLGAAMWVMAILSNWTVSQRIWYTWQETKKLEQA